MYIFTAAAVIVFLLIILMFFDELFPRCSLCRKIKPRPFFRLHSVRGLLPGYRNGRSICGKCSRKYDIDSFRKLYLVKKTRRKAELDAADYMNKQRHRAKS